LRQTSIEVPSGTAFGVSVGDFFCSGVSAGAIAVNWSLFHPVPFIALALGAIVALLAAIAATIWRPPDPHPLRRQRHGGQIFRAARRVYSENILTFAPAGVIFVPVDVVAASIQWGVFQLTSVAPLVALDGRHGAVTAFLAVLIGGVGGLFASVVTTAAVAVILGERDAGRRTLAGQAYRRVLVRWRSLGKGMATELGMVLLLTITVVGIPVAIHRFIRWSLFAQRACSMTCPQPNHCAAAPNWSRVTGGARSASPRSSTCSQCCQARCLGLGCCS
jgi:hypothetical protein